MSKIVLVTGGARSGKSTFAEEKVKELGGDRVLYIATASVFDEEMKERVKRHQQSRPSAWRTLERHWGFEQLNENEDFQWSRAAIVDCLGYMLNNIMFEKIKDWDQVSMDELSEIEGAMLKEVEYLCDHGRKADKNLVFVTNEVGMSLVPETRINRFYRDILGRAGQRAASRADEVYLCVCGIPMRVK